MKRYSLLFLLSTIILIIYLSPLQTAKANSQGLYLRVITEDTPFYLSEDEKTPLFYLPYTYYVKIIKENVDFYHVEYYGENGKLSIDGYVPKDMLFDDRLSASTRFPNVNIITAKPTLLYNDSELTSSEQYVFQDRTLDFYGKHYSSNGEALYFVSYNNRLGYVRESDVIPFTIPNHPNPLTFIPQEEPEHTEDTPPSNPTGTTQTETLRYIIIGCLGLAGLFALIVGLKNKQNKVSNGYFEENEYE